MLEQRHLAFHHHAGAKFLSSPDARKDLKTRLEDYEKKTLLEALEEANFDKKQVASWISIFHPISQVKEISD